MQEITHYAERMREKAGIRIRLRQKLLESIIEERKIKFCKTRMEEGGGVGREGFAIVRRSSCRALDT